MDSDDKFWLGFWVSAFTTLVAMTVIFFTLGKDDPEVAKIKIQAEQQLKMECIKNKGTWASVDNDNSSPYGCKI